MEAENAGAGAWPDVMACPFNPSTWQAGAKTEFKNSQVYVANSRLNCIQRCAETYPEPRSVPKDGLGLTPNHMLVAEKFVLWKKQPKNKTRGDQTLPFDASGQYFKGRDFLLTLNFLSSLGTLH